MPSTTVQPEDHDSEKDVTGFVHDQLGDHSGTGTLDRGYTTGSLTRNILRYYPLDDSSTGSTAQDRALDADGTINGASYTGSGQIGSNSLTFDGVDDYVSIPNVAVLTEYTIACWTYHSSPADGDTDVAVHLGANNDVAIRDDGAGSVEVAHTTSSGTVTATGSITASTWTYVAATWEGDTVRLFLDGTEVSSVAASDLSTASSADRLGSTGSGANFFDGRVDDVKIYERCLSTPEVTALSNVTTTDTIHDGDTV